VQKRSVEGEVKLTYKLLSYSPPCTWSSVSSEVFHSCMNATGWILVDHAKCKPDPTGFPNLVKTAQTQMRLFRSGTDAVSNND